MSNRVALNDVTILDRDNGQLPATIYDANGTNIASLVVAGNTGLLTAAVLLDSSGNPIGQGTNGLTTAPPTKEIVFQANTTQTANGNTPWFNVGTHRTLFAALNLYTVSGTFTTGQGFQMYLDISYDGGVTPFPVYQTNAIQATGAYLFFAGPGIATPASASLASGEGAGVPWTSFYVPVEFGDYIRFRWVLSGTTPSFNFDIKGVGK